MIRIATLLSLFACATPPALSLDAFTPLDAPAAARRREISPTIRLDADNAVERSVASVRATGVPVGVPVQLAWGTSLGDGACPPPLRGACLDVTGGVRVSRPLLSRDGTLEISLRVPARERRATLAFQLVGVDQPILSNPVERLVGAAGKPLDPRADTDGDGVSIRDGDCADHASTWSPRAVDEPGDGLDTNCDNLDGVRPCGAAPCASGVGRRAERRLHLRGHQRQHLERLSSRGGLHRRTLPRGRLHLRPVPGGTRR